MKFNTEIRSMVSEINHTNWNDFGQLIYTGAIENIRKK